MFDEDARLADVENVGRTPDPAGNLVPTGITTSRSHDVLPIIGGVYLLFQDRRLVYVGKSGDCHRRVAEHRQRGRVFDYGLVTPCPQQDAAWVEAALIDAWGPVQNRNRSTGAQVIAQVIASDDVAPVALRKGAARKRANDCGVTIAEFDEALKSGAIPSYPRNPNFTGHGSVWMIPVKSLDAWCAAYQGERIST